jgi:hypothetical protein
MDVHLFRFDVQGDGAAAIITPFVVLLLAWIVAIVARVRIARRQTDVWGRLIDRLGAEGVQALFAQGGAHALEAVLAGPERPHARIIVAAQAGVAATVFGVALLVLSVTALRVPVVIGVLVTASGVALLASAGVGYWLSDQWGLLAHRTDARFDRAE